MARIYVETTIASFYHEVRPEPEMVARRVTGQGSGSTLLVTPLELLQEGAVDE